MNLQMDVLQRNNLPIQVAPLVATYRKRRIKTLWECQKRRKEGRISRLADQRPMCGMLLDTRRSQWAKKEFGRYLEAGAEALGTHLVMIVADWLVRGFFGFGDFPQRIAIGYRRESLETFRERSLARHCVRSCRANFIPHEGAL